MARTIVKGPLAFTAADNTNLETYDASFVEVSAVGAGFVTIRSNKLAHRYGAGSVFIYRDGTPTYSADQYASAVLSFLGTLNVVRYGVAARISADTGAGQDWYAVTVDDVTSPRTTRVYKCVNGTVTTLDARTSVAWVNGDTVELEAITNGGACDLKVYKSGSLLYTISDSSSPLTSGKPGVYLYDTGGDSASLDNVEFGDATASAPALTSPTGAATGPTQATIGVTSDTAPTATAISYQILPAATADPSAPTIVGAPTGTISTGSAGALTAAIASLTTNTAVKVHFAQGTTSNVQSSAAFTPNTLAISGTALSAQTGTAGAAFTWTGATPESLITNTGNGAGAWTATAGVGASGVTVNSATGILVAGSLGTAGSYTITLQRADGSTVPGAQTVTKTVGLTISGGGGGDPTPPTLSAASVTGGTLSATGSVTSNEAGTLYFKMDGAATATDPGAGNEAGAGWSSQSLLASANAVSFGVQPAGLRYGHYLGVDAVGNRSTVANASGTVSGSGGTTYTAQTDIIAVAGIAQASTLVYWTWAPAGRPGAFTGPVNGSSTTDSAGRATISHTVAGDGMVLIGTRPGPVVSNDRVFAQFLTLA